LKTKETKMIEQMSSADRMVEILSKDPKRLKSIAKQEDPAKDLKEVADEAKKVAPIPSTPVYKMIVGFLGGVATAAIVGAIILVGIGKEAPEILIAVGSAAIGALAGTLVPASKSQ
jgi:hypothetical protein